MQTLYYFTVSTACRSAKGVTSGNSSKSSLGIDAEVDHKALSVRIVIDPELSHRFASAGYGSVALVGGYLVECHRASRRSARLRRPGGRSC